MAKPTIQLEEIKITSLYDSIGVMTTDAAIYLLNRKLNNELTNVETFI